MHVLQARVADQLVVRDAQLSQLETRPKHRPEPVVRDTASHKFEAGQLVTIPARNGRVGTGVAIGMAIGWRHRMMARDRQAMARLWLGYG